MTRLIFALVLTAATVFGQIGGGGGGLGSYSSPDTTRLYYSGGNLTYRCTAAGTQPTSTFSVDDTTLTSITDATNTATIVVPSHGFIVRQQITVSGAQRTASEPVIVDATNTATVTLVDHGLAVGDPVNIAGETGDTDLNGDYTVASAPTADTFTITTADVTDATYGAGITLTIGDDDLNGTYQVATVSDANTFTVTTADTTDASYAFTGLTITSTAPRTTAEIWAVVFYQYDGSDQLTSESAPVAGVACDDRASLAFK